MVDNNDGIEFIGVGIFILIVICLLGTRCDAPSGRICNKPHLQNVQQNVDATQ